MSGQADGGLGLQTEKRTGKDRPLDWWGRGYGLNSSRAKAYYLLGH